MSTSITGGNKLCMQQDWSTMSCGRCRKLREEVNKKEPLVCLQLLPASRLEVMHSCDCIYCCEVDDKFIINLDLGTGNEEVTFFL